MIDIGKIPRSRLALLDTATLFHGTHSGETSGAGCKYCARELLHEVVTGKHADQTPDGVSAVASMLPVFNDGPWLDDEHRTRVLRPYLRKILELDPARDHKRMFAVVDYFYRLAAPAVCDAAKLHDDAKTLRTLMPIVDEKSALAARTALGGLAGLADLAARLDPAVPTDPDGLAARTVLDALYRVAAGTGLDGIIARAAVVALDSLAARAVGATRPRSEAWEAGVVAILDVVCGINETRRSTATPKGPFLMIAGWRYLVGNAHVAAGHDWHGPMTTIGQPRGVISTLLILVSMFVFAQLRRF